MAERLTTLAALKDWLDITNDESDVALTRLIDAASQFTLNWLNRPSFAAADYTQNFEGMGNTEVLLRQWPVLSVSSVGVNGTLVPASTFGTGGMPSSGWRLGDERNAPMSLSLRGWGFGRGVPHQIIYRAGFETTAVMKAGNPVDSQTYVALTPTAGGQWSIDQGVTLDDVALTLTDDASAPPSGTYYVSEWGEYRFNPDAAGKTARITYSYVPMDVSFAVTELCGEWYKRKDRIGLLSKTLGGQETITFSQKDMGSAIRGTLQIYQNVVPV